MAITFAHASVNFLLNAADWSRITLQQQHSMPTTIRPIHWLGPGRHSVDHYIAVGRQAVQVALNHRALAWATASTPDVSIYNISRPNHFLWRKLEPGCTLPWAPLNRHLEYLFELDPSSRPVALMTSIDLVSWWSMLIKPDSFSNKDFFSCLSKPDFLVRFGFRKLALDSYWVSEEVSELAACLSMIGVGAVEILLAGSCDLCCVRRAAPASRRCDQCSRSKRLVDPEGQRVQAAKSMQTKRVRDRCVIPVISTPDDLHASFARSITSIFFTMEGKNPAYVQWLESVNSSFEVAPLVRSKLSSNFLEISPAKQFSELRNIIDRNEWDYSVWPTKILQAQAFTEASDAAMRRRRNGGPLPTTIDLANRARILLHQGLSMSEVALRLSISKSHLSHTLKRTSSIGG